MAVASETIMEPSPSKPASEFASEPSSPARISWAADTPDRSDHSNSSPNSISDSQSSAALRSEEYRQLFRLPPEEALVQDFNCAFQESILLQGHMYLFKHYVCFYSNIFGFETKKIIPFIEITNVKRAKTAGIFPNAIEIFAGGKKFFFASFLSRDEAFKLINDGLQQHGGSNNAMAEQQESISGSSSMENGLIPVKKTSSFKEDCDLESAERDKDASPSNDHEGSPPNFVENDGGSVRVAELQDYVEPVGCSRTSSVSRTSIWNEDKADAPAIRKSFTKVGEAKFPIKVEEFFNFFFSDDAISFVDSFHKKSGDKEFRCSSWNSEENFVRTRNVSFQHPIKIYFGAKFGSCQEVQKFRVFRNSHLVIETSQEISDVPFGDYFRVEGLWDIVRDGDESNEGCSLQIYVDVSFIKRTVFKGKIVQSTIEECREAYGIWIEMAHDLLKQKNLERQEGPTTSVRNEVSAEIETNVRKSSERPNDRRITEQTTGSIDGVENGMMGSLSSITAMVKPLVMEYTAKCSAFVRRQSQMSLVLAVAFAVIFLMQVSIVVLLNRPQKIVVAPGGEYYRTGEYVAMLETRAQHLKDDIFLVERQLERMRREFGWLKDQLKNLQGSRNHKH